MAVCIDWCRGWGYPFSTKHIQVLQASTSYRVNSHPKCFLTESMLFFSVSVIGITMVHPKCLVPVSRQRANHGISKPSYTISYMDHVGSCVEWIKQTYLIGGGGRAEDEALGETPSRQIIIRIPHLPSPLCRRRDRQPQHKHQPWALPYVRHRSPGRVSARTSEERGRERERDLNL
jgi:hypothetical protein